MPADILYIERERELQENRRQNNMRQTSKEIFDVDAEKRSKRAFSKNEQRLQALAAAERARREADEAGKKGGQGKAGAKPKQQTAEPGAKRSTASAKPAQPNVAEPKEEAAGGSQQRTCSVTKVHPDGSVDLQLASGEVVERVDKSWLQRLQMPVPGAGHAPPPSRPDTGCSTRPGTGALRPGTGASRPPTGAPSAAAAAAATKKGVQFASGHDAPAAIDLSDVPPVVNLDDTLAALGRRGGRASLGARRAAQSEILSSLTWE